MIDSFAVVTPQGGAIASLFWVVLALSALYFVLTVVSEFFKIHGEKVQNRNRHS